MGQYFLININIYYTVKHYFHILYSNLLYKMRYYFLDTQYSIYLCPTILIFQFLCGDQYENSTFRSQLYKQSLDFVLNSTFSSFAIDLRKF